MTLARPWVRIAIFNLILAAIVGLILRIAFVVEIPWMKYTDVLHAHSHMAMLGWGYLVVFALIFYLYRQNLEAIASKINRLFIGMEITVMGLFICFPFFGYGLPTVSFLTAHMLLSYIFIYYVWKRIPKGNAYSDNYWMKGALFFLILSTLGVWFIAPIYAMNLERTIWYYLAVQFFMHFEINAWFLFAVMGLFFAFISRSGIKLPGRKMKYVFYLFLVSCMLTYALAVAWSQSNWIVSTVNTSGVFLQTIGAGMLFTILWPYRKRLMDLHSPYAKSLFILTSLTFAAKIIIQLLLILPAFMEVAYTIRNFIVGFIHLILLGIFTAYVMAFLQTSGLFGFNKHARLGITFFIIGFISTELIIFTQGGMFWMAWGFLPSYYLALAIATLFLPLGLILFLIGLKKPGSKEISTSRP